MITTLIVIVWLVGTVGCYCVCRQTEENPAIADVAGSLVFWWLLLPFFTGLAMWRGTNEIADRIAERRKQKAQPTPALRSGSENGLYN
jgi:hypothetical protein